MLRRILAGTVAAACVLGIGFYVWIDGAHPTDESGSPAAADLDTAAKDRLAAEAAATLIVAESASIDTGEPRADPSAQAPPGFEPAPPVVYETTPPEGYSFTAYHEVARGPMTADDLDRDRSPADPPDWMTFGDVALADQAAAAGRDWSFGWVKLADGAGLEALRELLAAQGGEVLGQAGDLVRARLPGDPSSLQAIRAADTVAGLGAFPAERKITDTLAERAAADINEQVPVWITLMSVDPDGRWRRALKELGAEVGRFDPAVRSYAAIIPLTALQPIAGADYVLAVEAIGRVYTTLEVATPAMGADAVRSYDAATETFVGVGGASIPVGVMDTGLNIDHPDISSNRRSICGANFTNIFDAGEQDLDIWYDYFGHGSHVTGILLGTGAEQRNRVGVAPLVQDIRFAKAATLYDSASALGWSRALDWLAKPTACGGDDIARKALVINMSLGIADDIWEGQSLVERKIDASVWSNRQLFVTSAGNGDVRSVSSTGAAKNALSVGATQNIGDIAVFSSRGPTYDGRLLPKVVGTGVSVASASGRGATGGYRFLSGTSMASPAVAGVAALVMEAVPELKEEPSALAARLMASAIKPDVFLGDGAAFPLDNTNGPGTINNVYGLGKVSARTAVLSRDDEDGWTGGSAAFDVDADSHAYRDIVVPEGASRLDVVMTWDEPPADTISNPVLHDLDLWVDRGASCGNIAACGHYQSSSRIDNVEWVIVPNPPPGVYRLKVLPNRIYGSSPRAGLAWTVIRGDSTPTLQVAVDDDHIQLAPGQPFEVEATVSSDAYVAAGATLRVQCRTAVGSRACRELIHTGDESTLLREDGLERQLVRSNILQPIVVGEIGPDEEQKVSLSFPGRPEGSFRLHLTTSGWNAGSGDTTVAVVVGESEIPPPVQRPPNDDFAMAIELDGAGGETTFDLAAATPDPGEYSAYFKFPESLRAFHPERRRSLWYVWTAPEDGLARFAVPRSEPGDYADLVWVEVFHDGPLAGLEPLGDPQIGGGSTFFAEAGETYRVRLSVATSSLFGAAMPDLVLRWGPGSRPANDDYAMAADLAGESGVVSGTSQGATTEPTEYMGHASPQSASSDFGWMGSVWHRWTAPSTGDYRFSVNRTTLLVAVFEGDDLSEARMVSGAPAQGVRSDSAFPATEGVEYRIGVATGRDIWSSTDFELSWRPGARQRPRNDDFAAAAPTFGDFAASTVAFDAMTVEHGEPAATGVRTAWWRWRPSADGRYTWLARRAGFIMDEVPLQMAAFVGDELDALEVVAVDEGDETLEMRLVLDARADTDYRVSLGLPRDAAQVPMSTTTVFMEWGPTPENDDLANATALAGMSGSVSGSNEFATTEKGEVTGSLGGASMWWTFEPEESGWVRFEIDGPRGSKLAIYQVGADGGMELLRTSQNLGGISATVRFEEGARYVIRYGQFYTRVLSNGFVRRGEFELSWSPSGPPAFLRYVGSVESGAIAGDGTVIELDPPGSQAFSGDGKELYVASSAGIVVFERDPAVGDLSPVETLTDHPLPEASQLIWDEAGSALLVASCDEWLKFTPVEGGGIEHAGSIEGAPCAVGPVLVRGNFAHHVLSPWLIETFRFDEERDSLDSAGINMIPDVSTAVMTADGENVYALAVDEQDEYSVLAIDRDPETGSLSISTIIEEGSPTGTDGEAVVEGLADVKALAVQGAHLFLSVGSRGDETLVFDLADRANPVFLSHIPGFGRFAVACEHALARRDPPAVDVVCPHQLFVVQVGVDGLVFASDLVAARFTDSFGNPVPDNRTVHSVSASPDGRHIYVAGTERRGHVMVFERVFGD